MFLAREPLMDLAGKMVDGSDGNAAQEAPQKPEQGQARQERKTETVE